MPHSDQVVGVPPELARELDFLAAELKRLRREIEVRNHAFEREIASRLDAIVAIERRIAVLRYRSDGTEPQIVEQTRIAAPALAPAAGISAAASAPSFGLEALAHAPARPADVLHHSGLSLLDGLRSDGGSATKPQGSGSTGSSAAPKSK